jgi:hypothetical protein
VTEHWDCPGVVVGERGQELKGEKVPSEDGALNVMDPVGVTVEPVTVAMQVPGTLTSRPPLGPQVALILGPVRTASCAALGSIVTPSVPIMVTDNDEYEALAPPGKINFGFCAGGVQ